MSTDEDLRYVRRVLEGTHPTDQDRAQAIAIVQRLRETLRGPARLAYEATYPEGTPWVDLAESTQMMWEQHVRSQP